MAGLAAVSGAGGPAAALSLFGESIARLQQPMTEFYTALTSMAGRMSGFVEAFSPALSLQMGQSLRDLSATIGSALAPAFSVLIDVVKQTGSYLGPVFRELGRVLQPLIETLGGVAVGTIKTIASAFAAMAPLIEAVVNFLAPLVEGLGAMFRAVAMVVSSLVSSFSDGLDPKKNGLVTFGEQLRDLMQKLAGGFIILISAIAKWTGNDAFLDILLKQGAEPKREDNTGLAAAQNARYSGFAEFGRQLALSAATATGGGGEKAKNTDDWLQDVLEEVKAMRDGTESIEEVLERWGLLFAGQLGKVIVEGIQGVAKGAAAYNKAVNELDKAGRKNFSWNPFAGVWALDDLIFGRPQF